MQVLRFTMLKGTLIAAVLVLSVIIALVTRIALQSPRLPAISISFLGYTNDDSGRRVARFTVSNAEPSAICWSAPVLGVKTAGAEVGYSVPGAAVLDGGAPAILSIAPPTNATWRVHLRVYSDTGATLMLKRFVTDSLLKAGFRPRYQTMPYAIASEWVPSEN